MITISGTLSKAWMHEQLGVAFDRDYYFDPAKRLAVDRQCNDYALREFPGMGLFYSESNLGRLAHWDASQVLVGGIQPNMILGMLVGAEFIPAEDRDADITPAPLAGVSPADLPSPEDLLSHDLIGLFDDQIESIRCRKDASLLPVPPFFWDASGRVAIHGVLTTAQKLWGEAVFLDMMTEPERCKQIMAWIAEACVVLCRHFSQVGDLPIASVHVGECSCCMVSPASVTDFVAPLTASIGRELGPVRLHSCGASTHLLEAFAEIENLGALDLGGETTVGKAREVFGAQMPISIAPLPEHMSDEGAGPILEWAQTVLSDNAGGPLEYVYHVEPGYNLDTIRALADFASRQPDFDPIPLPSPDR